ncbi:MAG: serine/threonine-protein kinase, partial [Rudaea sp.]
MSSFERWLDADADAQDRLLADLERQDPELHGLVVAAIRTDRDAESLHFLEDGALVDAARSGGRGAESTLLDLLGEQVGPWRIERLLGVGGMGQVVLVARSDGLHSGRAALKMLRFAALDQTTQRRFAREGELLARLQHPHVARLLDVGESVDGRRFLVLEYVDGDRIDDWCDRRRATIERRLQLFEQVCDAIAYAHGNLIVHRDLKPSNILVDAGGVAKVLDFGMAKLLEGEALAGEMTELTRVAGAAFTPEYAAPEQFSGDPVTVATDVYSLGAVLYVLLVGHRPHGAADATPAQLARAVSLDEPRRLSLRVGETTGDTRRIAEARSTSAEQLQRALRGDLDTILAKALKRDPTERYASVQAFADDIRRYLDNRPIAARADSLAYRLRKYVRRHRVGVVVGSLLVLAVLAGVAGIAVEERIARREAARAETEAAKATQIANFTSGMLAGIDPDRAKTMDRTLIRSILDTAASNADRELAEQPAVRASIEDTIATSYYSIGESEIAVSHWQLALDAAKQSGGGPGPQARLMAKLSRAQKAISQYRKAHVTATQAVEISKGLPETDADSLYAQSRLAAVDCVLFRSQVCRDRFASVYALERRTLGEEDAETLATLSGLAAAEAQLGNHDVSRAHYAKAISGYTARFGASDSHRLSIITQYASMNDATGHYDENEKLLEASLPLARAALGEAHPITLETMTWLGITFNQLKRFAEAKATLLRALALYGSGDKSNGFTPMSSKIGLIDAEVGLGEYAAAEKHAREFLVLVKDMSGPHGDGGLSRSILANVLIHEDRFEEAEQELKAADAARLPRSPGATANLVSRQTAQRFVDLYTRWNKPESA